MEPVSGQHCGCRMQEAVDYIGISSLSGNHLITVPLIFDSLRSKKADDIKVVVGGIVPPDDVIELKRQGVVEVFGPGRSTQSIVDFFLESCSVIGA